MKIITNIKKFLKRRKDKSNLKKLLESITIDTE
jgi:hypothetical protein